MIIDFRRKKPNYKPVMVNGEAVEQVDKYRYLGLVIDNKLAWHEKTPMNSSRKSTLVSFVLEKVDHSECVRTFCRCFSCPLLAMF